MIERGFENRRLCSEEVAEFAYRSDSLWLQAYRMVVIPEEHLGVPKEKNCCSMRYALLLLHHEHHTSGSRAGSLDSQSAWQSGKRAGTTARRRGSFVNAPGEHLGKQLGVHGHDSTGMESKKPGGHCCFRYPRDVGSSVISEEKKWVLGLEFKNFCPSVCTSSPCQIVCALGRKLVYRLLSWNPHQRIFWRLITALRC